MCPESSFSIQDKIKLKRIIQMCRTKEGNIPFKGWWAILDLNHGPAAYEAGALTD